MRPRAFPIRRRMGGAGLPLSRLQQHAECQMRDRVGGRQQLEAEDAADQVPGDVIVPCPRISGEIAADVLDDERQEGASADGRVEDQRVFVRQTVGAIEPRLQEVVDGADDVADHWLGCVVDPAVSPHFRIVSRQKGLIEADDRTFLARPLVPKIAGKMGRTAGEVGKDFRHASLIEQVDDVVHGLRDRLGHATAVDLGEQLAEERVGLRQVLGRQLAAEGLALRRVDSRREQPVGHGLREDVGKTPRVEVRHEDFPTGGQPVVQPVPLLFVLEAAGDPVAEDPRHAGHVPRQFLGGGDRKGRGGRAPARIVLHRIAHGLESPR